MDGQMFGLTYLSWHRAPLPPHLYPPPPLLQETLSLTATALTYYFCVLMSLSAISTTAQTVLAVIIVVINRSVLDPEV